MKLTGSRQRVCLGGWLLAALLLLGLNAYRFMSLEQQPLVGYSQTIKILHVKLQQFDRTLAAGAFSLDRRMDVLRSFTSSSQVRKPAAGRPGSTAQADLQSPVSDPTVLPYLSGIMQVLGPHGSLSFQAVLNGRVCRERDKIDDFAVADISPAGVVVRRKSRQWLIKSPSPYYSSDQGE